jgi:hypothetical protein
VEGAVSGALEKAADRAEPPNAIEEPPASAEKHAESSQAELPRERWLEWLPELRAELRPLVERPPVERPPVERPPVERPPVERPPVERPLRERGSLAGLELRVVLAP